MVFVETGEIKRERRKSIPKGQGSSPRGKGPRQVEKQGLFQLRTRSRPKNNKFGKKAAGRRRERENANFGRGQTVKFDN